MAKVNPWAKIAVAGGMIAGSALLNRSRRKKAEREAEAAKEEYEAAMGQASTEAGDTIATAGDVDMKTPETALGQCGEWKCPNCGTANPSGTENCAFCSAPFKECDNGNEDVF